MLLLRKIQKKNTGCSSTLFRYFCLGFPNVTHFTWRHIRVLINIDVSRDIQTENELFVKDFFFLFLPFPFFDLIIKQFKIVLLGIFFMWIAKETDLGVGCGFKGVSSCFTCLKINKVVSDR